MRRYHESLKRNWYCIIPVLLGVLITVFMYLIKQHQAQPINPVREHYLNRQACERAAHTCYERCMKGQNNVHPDAK